MTIHTTKRNLSNKMKRLVKIFIKRPKYYLFVLVSFCFGREINLKIVSHDQIMRVERSA